MDASLYFTGGILTGADKTKWWTSTINKILRNKKYIGDALLLKTYTTDFLNKTRVKNNGIVPQYYVEGNHDAIIPKDIFLRVQASGQNKRQWQKTFLQLQSLLCADCHLWRMWSNVPQNSLEQSRLQIHRLALHQ